MWTKPKCSFIRQASVLCQLGASSTPSLSKTVRSLLNRWAPPSSEETGDMQENKPLREITQEGVKGRVSKKLVTQQRWGRGPSEPWPGAFARRHKEAKTQPQGRSTPVEEPCRVPKAGVSLATKGKEGSHYGQSRRAERELRVRENQQGALMQGLGLGDTV